MDNVSVDIGMAVVAVLTALASWFKNHADLATVVRDREQTKIDRDKSLAELTERVIKTEFQCATNKSNADLLFTKYDDLSAQIRLLTTELARATTELANTNERLKDLKHGRPDQ